MRRLKFFVLALIVGSSSIAMAQTEEVAPEIPVEEVKSEPENLQSIFNKMTNESHNYNNYEMIKEPVLATFWQTVTDSVADMKNKIKDLNVTQERLESEITGLKTTIEEQETDIASLKTQIEGFNFIGIEMTKSGMSILFWVVTLILAGIAVFCILLFFRANSVASTKVKNFNELQDEFTEYQKTMKERETVLRREFQTVQNKLWELEKKVK